MMETYLVHQMSTLNELKTYSRLLGFFKPMSILLMSISMILFNLGRTIKTRIDLVLDSFQKGIILIRVMHPFKY